MNSSGQRFDEVQHIDVARGLSHGIFGDGFVAEADIFGDGAGKEKRVLQNYGEVAAQRGEIEFAEIDAIEADGSGGDVVEAHHQAGQGGFAGAGVTDDGDGLAGLDGEGDVFQDPLDVGESGEFLRAFGRIGDAVDEFFLFRSQLLVGEPDVMELDAVRSVAGAGIGGADDFRRGIEQLEDAFAGGHGGLQDVVLVAQVLDGTPEALRIHVECGQHADGDGAGEDAESATPDDEGDGDRGEDFDRGVVERVGEDRVFERDHVQAVDGLEVVVGALFAVEKLHHGHAADVFLGKAVDAGDGGAHAAVALANAVAEEARDDEDERQNREGQQRQPPVDVEHHDGHDGEGEEVVDDGENAAGEHFVDGVDVGGDARDQAAHGMGIEEADVHALHVAEDVAAQVEHDLLAGPLHQVGLDKFEEIGGDLCHQKDHGEAGDALHGVGGQVAEKKAGRSAFMAQQGGA